MLLFIVGTIIITIVINSSLFTAISLIGMIITISTYIPIALVKAHHKSGALALVGMVIDILMKTETDDNKVKEMEDAVIFVMHEINRFYERKLKEFTNYLRKKKEGE